MALPPLKKNTNNIQTAIAEKLEEIRRKEEEDRARQTAQTSNLPYLNLVITPIEMEAIGLLDESKARKGKMAVIKRTDQRLHIAVLDSNDQLAKDTLKELSVSGFEWSLFIVSLHSLEKAWQRYKELTPPAKEITGRIEISTDFLKKVQQEIATLDDLRKKIQAIPTAEASKIIEVIIAGSLQTNASDIHIEAKETQALLRYRIDGLLRDVVFLPNKTYYLLLSKIKLLSEMKLNIHDTAQDGRFTVRIDEVDIENRVSIIPGAYGENIVWRVLDPKSLRPGLKDLGLRPDLYTIVEKQIHKPNGMLITTGPTGSGKTTALYAFLKTRTSPEIKIITLEDPIEYHLSGIVQTQVESERGYTFASGLRAILRQDPDIILVGEIRDNETAETAINSALTGHLVFSTLHTNDAAGAIPRFTELGVKPAVLSSALNLIMAQRLIRKICLECKEKFSPDQKTFKKIKNALENISKDLYIVDINKPFNLYRGVGCPKCDNSGYKGRIGIFEMIAIDREIEKLIASNPSHADITEMIFKRGITTMYQDGILKVLEGVTTIEEIESTTRPTE